LYKELCKISGKSYYSSFEKLLNECRLLEDGTECDSCGNKLTAYEKKADVKLVINPLDGKWYKDYTVPVNAALAKIVRDAEDMRGNIHLKLPMVDLGLEASVNAARVAGNIAWFYDQVNHNADWDIKREALPKDSIKDELPWDRTIAPNTYPGHINTLIYCNGEVTTPERLGNYTYGYIGRALGLPLGLLYAGSFVAADKSTLEKLQNEFNDWPEIKKGYYAYRR